MRRREFIALLGGAAAVWPPMARAQQQAMPVIGYMSSQSPEARGDLLRGFRRGLKEAGFLESENISIEYRWAEGRTERLPALSADLVRRGVAVIAASGGPASLAAGKATTTIPIVFAVPADPVRLGLVKSLAQPGGNMTGVNFFSAELAPKRLEFLRQLLPTIRRVAVLINPAEEAIAASNLRDVEQAVRAMGLQTRVLNASTNREIDTAFETIASERLDGLFISSGPFFAGRRVQLAHLATHYRIPAVHSSSLYPEIGGLMSYSADVGDAHRQAGVYVGRILKGTNPSDLPVVQSTKFELVINAHTAKLLALTVPPSLLAIADEVIE
jgi:putative ABC transport system substrate-binding protein